MTYLYIAISFFASLIMSSPVLAGDHMVCRGTIGERKWDQQCVERSAEYSSTITKPLKGGIKCAQYIPMRKNQSARCAWYPVNERHVPGLIAEAFYSRSKEQRESAFGYLEHFCIHTDLCRPFHSQLDKEVKAHILNWRKTLPDLATRAEKLRNKLSVNAPQEK